MITYKKEEVLVQDKIICDVCKKEYNKDIHDYLDDVFEIQEFTHISYTGGYGCIFGDESKIELDICQHCLKEKLGEFIRVKESEM